MGGVDIIPGVSGGTMALILGIYPRLVYTLGGLTQPAFLRPLARLRLRKALEAIDWPFLLALSIGVGTAILTLSRGLEWLLEHQRSLLFSFFFGLILASVLTIARKVQQWRMTEILGFVAAASSAFAIVGLTPTKTPDGTWFLFLSGALAICALVLPGISGAFVLVLLNKYDRVLSAVNGGDLATLAAVTAGALVGLLSFVRLLSWLFERYERTILTILAGFMLGSLRRVWPWQLSEADVSVPVLPPMEATGDVVQLALAALLVLAGLALIPTLERMAAPN